MSGVETQGVRWYVESEVAEIHTVPQDQSRMESHGTSGGQSQGVTIFLGSREPWGMLGVKSRGATWYAESGVAESHAVYQEQSHREPRCMSGAESQGVTHYARITVAGSHACSLHREFFAESYAVSQKQSSR